MRKILVLLLFVVPLSAKALLHYWVIGSIAAHAAAIFLIQFNSSTSQPTGKTISVKLKKTEPDERNIETPAGWSDPDTPPPTTEVTLTETWEGGSGIGNSAGEACNSAADVATSTYSITYTGEITTCWNGGQSCNCRLTNTESNFFDVTVAVTGTTNDCPPGYTYDGTVCQLTDASLVDWPTKDDLSIIEISPSGNYECNAHDPDCEIPPEGVVISGDTVTATSDTQVVTVTNNGTGNGTTVTIQNTDGGGNGTSWTQHHYSDNGDLESTQTGIGDAPGTPGGTGQTTGIGDCGGPGQVPCDVTLSTEGMPTNIQTNEYDTIIDSAYQPIIDDIGSVNIDHQPLIGDWGFLNSFPIFTACGDLTLSAFGRSITFPYSKLTIMQEILAWIFYIFTALAIFNIAVRPTTTEN